MPENRRGSVSARLTVWFSRRQRFAEAREIRVEHLEAAAVELRESRARPATR